VKLIEHPLQVSANHSRQQIESMAASWRMLNA
jgi:hypothetical protein